jgi:undecaprenyl-diphosphatase
MVLLSVVSKGLNVVLKLLVARPRPTSHLVDVFQVATGQSFPSEHVMAYLAFWVLLFCFGIILFQGKHWWRILLLVVCATLVVLVGPSRIYLGDHWASDVMGSYLIGGVLLGVTLWVYLKLKERGILETKSMRERTVQSEVFRSFPRK